MSWYGIKKIWGGNGIVKVTVQCRLDSLLDAHELIDSIVRAKNAAFPSEDKEHRTKMEALTVKERKEP